MIPPIVVMGVSGCGKSTLAEALARRLAGRFVEGDDCHPPANVAKMAAGIPLDDQDRRPFLEAVAAALNVPGAGPAVASCSALKRAYRDLIRACCGDVVFVLPSLTRDELLDRLEHRQGHFMPVAMLDSQLATLEAPGADEGVIVLDGSLPTQSQVDAVTAALGVD